MTEQKTKKTRAPKKLSGAALSTQLQMQPLETKLGLLKDLKESIESDRKSLEAQLGLINGK